MYRILGMSNRAKGMLNKLKTENKQKLNDAIKIFDNWMKIYHKIKI